MLFFYTICLVFCYTLWHFYAFSGTNLLTRCHSASFCFLLFLCFRKVTQKIFSELDETKAERPDIKRSFQNTEQETEPSQGPASPWGGAAQPLAAPPMGETTLVHLWCCPFSYKDPLDGKNLSTPINFLETHHDPPPSSTRDQEDPEALPDTLPERGIATRGLLHRHACLRRGKWVVYLELWVHSSS
jgi:hypothetical protein